MSWRWEYIFLLLASTTVDFFCAKRIEQQSDQKRKKRILWISPCTNLGMLFWFKYIGFFGDMANDLFQGLKETPTLPNLHPLLPVGISFYTFQTLGYTIDVYRGKFKAEKNFFTFALYVSYFPQLVAGPIERASSLMPQLRNLHQGFLDYRRFAEGAVWIMVGLFKKVVIADNLALVVTPVYDNPEAFPPFYSAFATFCFAYQIFGDFIGYSDIAVGTAKILNVKLIHNFKRPFMAKDIADLWRRLHISLGLWLREYIYIPLGGNQGGKWMHYRNISIVFLLSGFWHGGEWHFVLWGALGAILYLAEAMTKPWRQKFVEITGLVKLPITLRILQTMKVFALFCLMGPFFRAHTTDTALLVYEQMFLSIPQLFDAEIWKGALSLGLGFNKILIVFGCIFLMEIVHIFQERKVDVMKTLFDAPRPVRYAFAIIIVTAVLILGAPDGQEFIYFRF